MRPAPFTPEPIPDLPDCYVRDTTGGHAWHRVFNRPLYADTDRSTVVYHANYLRFFELGRSTLMRDAGYPYGQVEAAGFIYPIVDLALQYHKPLFYDDPMWVHTRPAELGRVQIRFEYVITRGDTGQVVTSGHTNHCALNREGKVTAIDEATLDFWNNFPK